MATKRKFNRYPVAYMHLMLRAHLDPLTISFKEERTARNFRRDLYNYRQSLRDLEPEETSLVKFLDKLNSMSFTVTGTTVRIGQLIPHVETE